MAAALFALRSSVRCWSSSSVCARADRQLAKRRLAGARGIGTVRWPAPGRRSRAVRRRRTETRDVAEQHERERRGFGRFGGVYAIVRWRIFL